MSERDIFPKVNLYLLYTVFNYTKKITYVILRFFNYGVTITEVDKFAF